MSYRTLLILADFSFELGLIDISEYIERQNVARWLANDDPSAVDPREPNLAELDEPRRDPIDPQWDGESTQVTGTGKPEDSDWLELLVLGKWLFTRSDPDPYPSTPHGHLHDANRPWPRLNPYTGRAFKAKHQEDARLRLTKHQMREIWRTEAFRDFCRSYILWYIEANPQYVFSVRHPLRFPRW